MAAGRYRLGLGSHGEATRLVRETLEARGWQETGGLDWRLYWDLDLPEDGDFYRQKRRGRLINHLWGIGALNEKGRLWQTLSAARERLRPAGLEGLYDFVPRTFLMPDDAVAWRTAAAWNADLRWIRKPRGLSRGRGVELVTDPASTELGEGWLVQQYIDTPHLIDGRKYTLRFYVLVASLDPLLVYLYSDGFVKLAAHPYRAGREHLGDRFMHLTNPDVLKEETGEEASARNLTHTVWRERLRAEGIDDEELWRRIRRLIAATVIAAREPMLAAMAKDEVRAEGCFELLGFDITLDRDLNPWLLECNASPSLQVEAGAASATSRAENELKRGLVDDLLRLMGADEEQIPVYGDEPAHGRLEAFEARLGRFERLYPAAESIALLPCLERMRESDLPLLRHALRRDGGRLRLHARGADACPLGDRLVLHLRRDDSLTALNPTASFAWLAFGEGLAPDEVAAELAAAVGAPSEAVEQDVWNTVMDWMRRGLLRADAPPPEQVEPRPAASGPLRRLGWNRERCYRLLGQRMAVRYPGAAVEDWLHPTLAAMEAPGETMLDAALEVIDCDGYRIAGADGRSVEVAAGMAPAMLHRELLRAACRGIGAVLAWRGDVLMVAGRAVLMLDGGCFGDDGFDAQFESLGGSVERQAALLLLGDPLRVVRRQAVENAGGDVALTPSLHVEAILRRRARGAEPLASLPPAEVLMQLLAADAAALSRLDSVAVARLVAWMAGLECVELRGTGASAATRAMERLTRETMAFNVAVSPG